MPPPRRSEVPEDSPEVVAWPQAFVQNRCQKQETELAVAADGKGIQTGLRRAGRHWCGNRVTRLGALHRKTHPPIIARGWLPGRNASVWRRAVRELRTGGE
jgi:hypothetical protein